MSSTEKATQTGKKFTNNVILYSGFMLLLCNKPSIDGRIGDVSRDIARIVGGNHAVQEAHATFVGSDGVHDIARICASAQV
jgi:hypothetical protein